MANKDLWYAEDDGNTGSKFTLVDGTGSFPNLSILDPIEDDFHIAQSPVTGAVNTRRIYYKAGTGQSFTKIEATWIQVGTITSTWGNDNISLYYKHPSTGVWTLMPADTTTTGSWGLVFNGTYLGEATSGWMVFHTTWTQPGGATLTIKEIRLDLKNDGDATGVSYSPYISSVRLGTLSTYGNTISGPTVDSMTDKSLWYAEDDGCTGVKFATVDAQGAFANLGKLDPIKSDFNVMQSPLTGATNVRRIYYKAAAGQALHKIEAAWIQVGTTTSTWGNDNLSLYYKHPTTGVWTLASADETTTGSWGLVFSGTYLGEPAGGWMAFHATWTKPGGVGLTVREIRLDLENNGNFEYTPYITSVRLNGPASGVTFYASLDQSLTPNLAEGVSLTQGSYVAATGKVGQGTASSGNMKYYGEANMSDQQGTLSFWMKLNQDLSTSAQDFSLFHTDPLALLYTQSGTIYYAKWYSTYINGALSSQWDYSLNFGSNLLPANQWHNVVLMWGKGTLNGAPSEIRRIYINNSLVGQTETNLSNGYGGSILSFCGGAFPAVYDEVIIWDRLLSSWEITQLYTTPAKVAEVLQATPPLTEIKNWVVYPGLVYKQWNDSLISPGQTYSISLPLTNRTSTAQSGNVVFRVLDLWGNQVGSSQQVSFSISASGTTTIPGSFTVDRLGIFKVEVTVNVDSTAYMRDVTTFACLPAGNPPKHSFFGGHINFDSAYPGLAEMGRRLGFANNRSHNMTQYTWWSRCEPEPGVWSWLWQSTYNKVNNLGYGHLGQWFGAPYWAVTLPDGTHPTNQGPGDYPGGWVPTDQTAFKNYVHQTIDHMPEIRDWEIWNEPFFYSFFKGMASDYVQLCNWAYAAAKQADPTVTVYAQIDNTVWTQAALNAGLLNYCDGLSYHWYAEVGEWDDAINFIQSHKNILSQYTGGSTKPLLDSETGIAGTTFLRGLDFAQLVPEENRPPLNYKLHAERMVQYYVTTMSEGVRAWYLYYHQPTGPEASYFGWNTTEITKTPRPFVVALAMLAWQLDAGSYVEKRVLMDQVHSYFFNRNDGTSIAVVWTEDETPVNIVIGSSTTAYDLMNNPISHNGILSVGPSPIYLRSPSNANLFATTLAYNNGDPSGFGIPGDANSDGVVDVGDLGILAANYGQNLQTQGIDVTLWWGKGDFNGDGVVDVGDLGILAANYGANSNTSIDFNTDYTKAFGTTIEECDPKASEDGSSSICSAFGLPLMLGFLFVGLITAKLDK
jgi:hypothetical protein